MPVRRWGLGDEMAADGEVEDGLAELLDVLGAGGEAREVAEVEAGVLAEGLRVGALVQALQGRCHQPIAAALPLRLRRLQPIAQRHQLVHLGDDAVLFGKGWERERQVGEHPSSRHASDRPYQTSRHCPV